MKSWKYLSLLVFFMAFAATAQAQAMKIGLVDFQEALNQVEEGRRAKAALKAQFDAKQKSLTDKQNTLKALKDQLETQRAALSAEAMKQKEAEYRDRFLDLQKTLAESRNEMATKEAEMTQGIVQKLRGAVTQIGQKEGFNLIFETSSDAILYAPQAVNLTPKLIQAYNSGGGGAAK